MIKAMSFLKRKQTISHEEFSRHYEETHAPLAMRYFPFKRYIRNYVGSASADELGFDCITEVWFETMEDCAAAAAFTASEDYKVISDDEETFMDRSKTIAFLVEEMVTE